MKRTSILGAGWLGLPLATRLNQEGYNVKVSSRSAERLESICQAGLVSYAYDIDHLTSSNNDFLDADILIINITSKNVDAFENLIKNIETSPIQHVLFISSTSVYKNDTNLLLPPISEDQFASLVPCPLLDIETLFQKNTNFNSSIIRFSGLMGYQRHPGKFFLVSNDDEPAYCKPIKNPDARVNMIHRDDCIEIIKSVIEKDCWGEILNACASQHPTRREFYRSALNNLGDYSPTFSEPKEPEGKVICNEKLKEKLAYEFIHDDISKFNLMPFDETTAKDQE